MEEVAVFRSTKRRKISRPRHHQGSPGRDADQASSNDRLGGRPADNTTMEVASEPDEVDVSNLVRARKNHRNRAGGVHFSTADAASDHDLKQIEARAMVQNDQVPEKRIDISDRFTSGTGQVVNDDHHMIAYIDSEMAKRRNLAAAAAPTTTMNDPPRAQSHEDFTKVKPLSASDNRPVAPSQPVSLSGRPAARQLAEVDLGSSAHDGNLARTQAALERAKLGLPPVEDEVKPPKPRKPRLGRDGKPFRPRPRKRRNSEDLARDALVEQLMRENKLDIYAANELVRERERQAGGGAESGGDDHHSGESDADERMAEQFRQDFMDAMAERRQRARAKAQSKSSSGAPTESRGPKLGGSRSARAKMHQQQQQQQQQPGAPGKK